MKRILALFITILLPIASQAEWALDNSKSSLSFSSIKNGSIIENHTFTRLEGNVDNNGLASLKVHLDTVETIIPIRNERMREMLFATKQNPFATVSIQLDADTINRLATNSAGQEIDVAGNLTMNGQSQRVAAKLIVAPTADGGVMVTTTQPILIAVTSWGMGDGIEALREVAGLMSITPVAPVSFNLKFQRSQASPRTSPSGRPVSTNIE